MKCKQLLMLSEVTETCSSFSQVQEETIVLYNSVDFINNNIILKTLNVILNYL